MANQITKILIRSGTDVQRTTANGTGIIFSVAEPAYTTDTKRLYIGDGITSGGYPAANRNLGSVSQLFGTSTNGFTNEALSLFLARGSEIGDIIYDQNTRALYSLDTRTTIAPLPPLSSDFIEYATASTVDNTYISYNGSDSLTITPASIDPTRVSSSLAGAGLTKGAGTAPIQIQTNGVTNNMLAQVPAYSIKGNPLNTQANVQDIILGNNQVLGLTNGGILSAIPFNSILQSVNNIGTNGIQVYQSGQNVFFQLSSNVFNVTPSNTIISTSLSCVGNIASSGDIIAFSTSDINLKENLVIINDSLNKVSQLSGYMFDWKNDNRTPYIGHDVGLIAQNVEEVLPEAVITRDNGIKALDYNKIIPLLVEAIKELKTEIEELKNAKL